MAQNSIKILTFPATPCSLHERRRQQACGWLAELSRQLYGSCMAIDAGARCAAAIVAPLAIACICGASALLTWSSAHYCLQKVAGDAQNLLMAASTASGVMPNFSYSTGPGAEAPKVSTPMAMPLGPMWRSHPKVDPACRDAGE